MSSLAGVQDIDLVGVQKTLSPVLRAKALDNRLPDPILGDEYVDEAPMNDSPALMAKAPANVRRVHRLLNLPPGTRRSTRIVRFRFQNDDGRHGQG